MTYYFNLPKETQLTPDQRSAVNEASPLALSGGPGTGKSVVSLWRHIRNHERGRDSLLLTYTKSLEYYLKLSANTINTSAGVNVDRTYRWVNQRHKTNYEEIIIDEGQDVKASNYSVIQNYCKTLSYGADERQSVYLSSQESQDVTQWFRDNCSNNSQYDLIANFRNSKEILLFIKSIFTDFMIPRDVINSATETGLKPIVHINGWDEDNELEYMVDIIDEYHSSAANIGILVPSVNKVKSYYNRIKEAINGKKISKYHNQMDDFETLENIHVTTFKSSKGLEFDTVIIPGFDSFDYFVNGDYNFSENDYYVACTRTKRNLFLICKKNPRKGDSNTYNLTR
jgi:superfamily I DNA/RNA helicase